jgi:hypothetical protein
MTIKLLLAGVLTALLALPVGAQQASEGTPERIRGTVQKLDGQVLTVNTREGQRVMITFRPPLRPRGAARNLDPAERNYSPGQLRLRSGMDLVVFSTKPRA